MLTKKQTKKSEKLLSTLLDIGMNDKEASIYLAALGLGSASVSAIAREAGIKRTTTYSVIESLAQKGFVRAEMKKWKRYFVAENPENLASLFEIKKLNFERLLPNFSALYNLKGDANLIKYYEGHAAIKSLYSDILQSVASGDTYLVISNDEKWFGIDPEYFQEFTEKRAKQNIRTRLLLKDSQTARNHKKFEKNFNEEIRFLPRKIDINTNMVITPTSLVIHQLIPPVHVLVIETKSIVDLHRQLFEIIWAATVNE